MRHNANSRPIKVDKAKLIAKIKENKANHLVEYQKAVEAYKKEAKKQLAHQMKELKNGSLKIHINLTAPSNREEDYDKLLMVFEYELDNELILSQGEFNEYVLDETDFAVQAKMLNSMYLVQ